MVVKISNVYGTPQQTALCYAGVRHAAPSPESNPLRANATFFAYPVSISSSLSRLQVVPLTQVGAVDSPSIEIEESISDFAFNPFNDRHLAISGNQNVHLFDIPQSGVSEGLKPTLTFAATDKRLLNFAEFHPLAEGIFLTNASDKTIRFWDLGAGGAEKLTLSVHDGFVGNISWNPDGSIFASTAKDKKLRIVDPRANTIAAITDDHAGAKLSRCAWLGDSNMILSAGFKKGAAERELAIFDARKLGTRVYSKTLDHLSSGLFPVYDPDLSLLYLIGKGDGNIRVFQFNPSGAAGSGTATNDVLGLVGEYKSSEAQAGFAPLPKKCGDLMKCEVSRVLKLTNSSVIPIRFEVTRQNAGYIFHSDLYPDAWDGRPVYGSEDWFGGAKGQEGNKVALKP